MEPVHTSTKRKKICYTTNLESLRKLIILSSEKNVEYNPNDIKIWQPVLSKLLHLLCSNNEIGNETILLVSCAYVSLQRFLYTANDFESNLFYYFNLQTNNIINSNEVFKIGNIKLFQLLICNGFLQLKDVYSSEIYKKSFEIIYPYCVKYTRYTYFAFKILQLWMQRTSVIGFWSENSLEFENKIEEILFSNWDNAIYKSNVFGIFVVYLNIMKTKYDDFLTYLFKNCLERISWCHVTKYVILSEICNALENIELLTESKFISNLFSSLTNKYLFKASTKVYTNICKKMPKDLWIRTFGNHLTNYVTTWETEKKYNTLQEFCKCWIEPLLKTYRDILPYLLENCDEKNVLYQSHLFRLAKKYGIQFLLKRDTEKFFLYHKEEFIRLNMFAGYCYEVGNPSSNDYPYTIITIKQFLYFHATTDTTYMREGIFNHFKILFSHLLKRAFTENNLRDIILFLQWLYEFQINCFEFGSCYQRKIFGLQLFKISLQFLHSNNCSSAILSKDPTFKEALKYGPLLKREMDKNGKWKFTSKECALLLFKLVLDSDEHVQDISSTLIIDFFDSSTLSRAEKIDILKIALEKCNSYKICEINSGAFLFKILIKWLPSDEINLSVETDLENQASTLKHQSYSRFLLEESRRQLELVKKDIFKAVTENTPFYGVAMALLMAEFTNAPTSSYATEFLSEVLSMTTDAVNYFLNAFSLRSSNLAHSSTFEEMSLAINESIRNSEIEYEFKEFSLSPAHQIITTCIWRSLKILCEMCVKIAKSEHATDSMIHRSSEVIVRVLLKCRYKGVIEAAGVAIANLSRYLCNNEKHVKLLEDYLKKLLCNDFSTNLNLTRRGAGLTIMFHKIIANDTRDERPLLHYAIKPLMLYLREQLNTKQEAATNYDDPCAMHLHFLKNLVEDKQLQSQMSLYLEDICLICFEYMQSRIFPIRNASLQLFGAIVPRLVGQSTGVNSVDFGYGYSFNYFKTHFPQLAAHILNSLRALHQSRNKKNDGWKDDANVIHILSLLSKMFFSEIDIIDGTSADYVEQIKAYLYSFLGSPIAHVRDLASKAFAASVAHRSIDLEIDKLKGRIAATSNFNLLNGYLSTLEYLHEKQDEEHRSVRVAHSKMRSLSEVRRNLQIQSNVKSLWGFWSRRSALIKQKQLCYAVEAQLLRLSRKLKIAIKDNCTPGLPKADDFYARFEVAKPGFFEFVSESMSLYVDYAISNDDYALLGSILGAKCTDFGIGLLKFAPRCNRKLLIASIEFANDNFDKSHKILLEEINIYAKESVKSTFQGKHIQLQHADVSKLNSFATKLKSAAAVQSIHLSELLISVRVLSLRGTGTPDIFDDVLFGIANERITIENYFNYSESLRNVIAKSLEILLYNFEHLTTRCKIKSLLASLVLLTDEVDSINRTVRQSLLNNVILRYDLSEGLVMDDIIYSILLLNLVSERPILGNLSDQEVIEIFKKLLSTLEYRSDATNAGIPFSNSKITRYREDSKIINFIAFCMRQRVSKGSVTKDRGKYESISCSVLDSDREVIKKINIDSEDVNGFLKMENFEYLSEKLKVVREVYFNEMSNQ